MKRNLLYNVACFLIVTSLSLSLNAQIDDPVVYYNFDEIVGTTVQDGSGNSNNGTLAGEYQIVEGKFENAVYFSSEEALVEMPASDIGLTTNTGSVAFWMISALYDHLSIMWWAGDGTDRTDSFGSGAMHIHFERTEGDHWLGGELAFYSSAPDGNNFLHSDPDKFGETTDPGADAENPTLVADSVWHHVVIVWGGGNMQMYIDGTLISVWEYLQKTDLQLTQMQIGRAPTGTRVFNGTIDEFRIYNRALSPVDVTALYNFDPADATSVSAIRSEKFGLAIGPNPVNAKTTINYQLDKNSDVNLTIYNITGQKVRTLVQERQLTGSHSVSWDRSNNAGIKLNSGMYVCVLQVDGKSESKIILVE